MNHTHLSNTDFSISEIGLGTMSFTGERSQNQRMIDLACEKGVNFLDTADLYQKGDVERMLATCLREKRNQFILATKVGNVWNSDGHSWHWDPSPKQIRRGLEQSLLRLQTDYVDLYQLHGGTIDDPWDGIFDTFQSLKSEGKIRAFGVSSIRPNVVRILLQNTEISTLMCQYSLLDRRPEEFILPALSQSPVKLLARGVLAKGLLVDKPAKSYLNYSEKEVLQLNSWLNSLEVPKEAIALGSVLGDASVASAVIGASQADQLQATLEGYQKLKWLDAQTLSLIRDYLPVNFYDSHR